MNMKAEQISDTPQSFYHDSSEKVEVEAGPETEMARLYLKLFDVVNTSLSQAIDKEKIEGVITEVVQAFVGKPCSELLLYTYTVSHDNYLIAHITNNVILAVGFGASLGLVNDDAVELGLCAFCHDFGMIDYTHLFQKGHQLTESENRMLQNHVAKSAKIFQGTFSDKIVQAIYDMHEQVNGQGYPNGKKGAEISFLAKIVAICDVFESLTHPRNFRREFSPYESIKLIINKKGEVFDGRVVKRFVEFMSIYPIGSLVELNTGEAAMVIGSNRALPTKPVVRVLLTPKRELDQSERIIDIFNDHMVYIAKSIDSKQGKEILHFLKPRGNFKL